MSLFPAILLRHRPLSSDSASKTPSIRVQGSSPDQKNFDWRSHYSNAIELTRSDAPGTATRPRLAKKHSSMGCFRLWWPTDMGDALQEMHKPSHARFVSYLRPPSTKPPNTLGESRSNNRLEAVIRTKLRRFSENDYVCPSNRLPNPQKTI